MEIITELERLNQHSTICKIRTLSLDQPQHMNDEKLLEDLRKGNIEAFEKLFRRYYASLFNYAMVYVKQKDDAEEVVQDLFFNLWKNKEKLNITSSIKSYLFRSVYNNSIQLVRKKRKTISVESEQIKKDEGKSESDHLQYKELNDSIQKVLSILPERSRKIFELSRFEGLKYQEIAEKLSISVKTVEANMTKTLKTFRKHLKQYRNLILLF